jgi:Prokaryotic phospholipase A2
MALCASFLLAACFTASPPPAPHVIAESLVFQTSLTKFIAIADSDTRDSRLDWSTDGCSVPVIGSTGRSFNFYSACRRHDFAYRNIGKLDGGKWWTASMRARIDAVFKKDMLANCAVRPTTTKRTCVAWAETFYRAVRAYAGP